MVCITDPSGGPGACNKLLPGAHGYDVERDVIAVLRSERIAHSTHHLRQVTAAVSVHVRRFLHQSDSPRTKGKGKGSTYSITERRVPELIPVLGSQPAGDVSHKPSGRLPLVSARSAVTLATLKKAATNFAAW